jgi:hypothetical protein
LLLSTTSILTAETIEFKYFGSIDKPLTILILNQNDVEFDVQYSTRANNMYSSVGIKIVVDLTIPEKIYNLILKNIIISSERPLLHRNMSFFCTVSSGYTKKVYHINVEDLIFILEDAVKAIIDEDVNREINNYLDNVRYLLERFGSE